MEDMERLAQALDENRISLNEDVRRNGDERGQAAQGNALEGTPRAQAEDDARSIASRSTPSTSRISSSSCIPGKLAAAKKNGCPEGRSKPPLMPIRN